MIKKKTVRNKRIPISIYKLRAIVRPMTIMYSVTILSILAIMAMSGYSMPVEGVGANCVNALIGIAGLVITEYAVERGIKNLLDRKK